MASSSSDIDENIDLSQLTLLSSTPKLPTPLLFRIPQALLVGIVSEWLDLKSIGILDTTMCSKAYRPLLLICFQVMRSETVEDVDPADWSSFNHGAWSGWWWQWLSLRQIYVESVILSGKLHNSIWSNAMENDEILLLPSLQKVHFVTCSDDDLGYLIRTSPNIQSLSFETHVSLFYPKTGFASHYFSSRRNDPFVSHVGLNAIAQSYQHCLESFSFERRVWCGYGPVSEWQDGCEDYFLRTGQSLINLFQQCSRLHSVRLTGDTLRAVDDKALCPFGHLFRELPFEDFPSFGLSDQSIANLLRQCINLRKAKYNGSRSEDTGKLLVLTALYQSCSMLMDLQLTSIYAHTWQTILPSLFVKLSYLRKLILTECTFTDDNFRTLAWEQPFLNDLRFHDCEGLTNTGISYLSKLRLTNLEIEEMDRQDGEVHVAPSVLTEAAFESFAAPESFICNTLQSFNLHIMVNYEQHRIGAVPIADDQVAMSFATCRKLKFLHIFWGAKCEFGLNNGTIGLEALVRHSSFLI